MQTVHSNIPYELVHGHEMEIRIHRGQFEGERHKYIQAAKAQMINLVQECEFNSIPSLDRWRELDDGTMIHTRLSYGRQVVSIYPAGGGDVYGQGFSITPYSSPPAERVSPHIKLAVIGSTASIDDSFDSPAGAIGKDEDIIVHEWHSTDWTRQAILAFNVGETHFCTRFGGNQLYILSGKEEYELIDVSVITDVPGKEIFAAWYRGSRLRIAVRETWEKPGYSAWTWFSVVVYERIGSQWSEMAVYQSEYQNDGGHFSGTGWCERIMFAASSSGNTFVVIDLERVEISEHSYRTHQKEVYFNGSIVSEVLREDTRLRDATDYDAYVSPGSSWWVPVYDTAPEEEFHQVEEYDYVVSPLGISSLSAVPLYNHPEWEVELQPAIELINLAPPGEDPIYDDEYYYTFSEIERSEAEAIWLLENPTYSDPSGVYKEVEYDENYPPGYYSCINGFMPIPARSEWSWPNWEGVGSTGVSWVWGSGYKWVTGGAGDPGWVWYQATVGYGGFYGIKAGTEYLKGFKAACTGEEGGTSHKVANEIMEIAFKPGSEDLTYYYFKQTGSYHTSTRYNGIVTDDGYETLAQRSIEPLREIHTISGTDFETEVEYAPWQWSINETLTSRYLLTPQVISDASFFKPINLSTGTFLLMTFTPSADNDDEGIGPLYRHLLDDYETIYRYTLYHFWKEIDVLYSAKGGDNWDFEENETTYPPYDEFSGAVDYRGNLLFAYQNTAYLYTKDGRKILDPAGASDLSPTGYYQIHAIAGYER